MPLAPRAPPFTPAEEDLVLAELRGGGRPRWSEDRPATPCTASGPATMAFLRSALLQFDPWHAWMNATGWEKSVDNARRGAAFVGKLRTICGDPPGSSRPEVYFLERAGDHAAALQCLDADLARLPARDSLRLVLASRRRELVDAHSPGST